MPNRSVVSIVFYLFITTWWGVLLADDPATIRAPKHQLQLAQASPAQKPPTAQPNPPVPRPAAPAPDVDGPVPDDSPLPPEDTSPILRLETGGPRSYVSSLAFSPDGSSLYACGWDKAVQVWNRNPNGRYEYSSGATLRVPTGSGLYGGLNAMAISSDGRWLATAGQSHARDMSSERSTGWVMPAGILSRASQLDEGLIYVFDTGTRTSHLLRGHRGPVQSLAFVRDSQSNPPELVSIAEERTDGANDLKAVIRYWNVKRGVELASLNAVPLLDGKTWKPLPRLEGWRPGLTAWSIGSGTEHARVAIAWGDDQIRIWDTQTGQVANATSGPNTLSVLPLSGGRLLTGAHADIGIWTLPVTDKGRLGALSRQQYQPSRLETMRPQNLPSVATLVPSKIGEPPLALFVVTRYLPREMADYRLLITTTTSPIKVVREFDLPWRGEIRSPAVAVTNDGRMVAVSGNDSSEIAVYPVNDLIAGRNPSPQVLSSRGINLREATFVRDGDHWGVAMSDVPNKTPGRIPEKSMTFDIEARRIEPTTNRWHLATAPMEGWSAEAAKTGSIQIRRPNQPPLTLQFDEQQVVSTYAFCPPSAQCPAPLIALATHLRGQPLLQVYRGDTGEPVRWCIGHTERISRLAFSDDGRMLLSLAADRTVSVWTMTDLSERTLGQHGRIAGVVVHPQDKKLMVTEAPNGNVLRVGDELISFENKGEVTSLLSTKDFYQIPWDRLPGDSLTLNIRRNGKQESVKCDVGQAIDESKPLFSLFVTPGESKEKWDWIGWHPLGNYDASREEVERLLGWQFNTGNAERPAKFAAIGDYRDGFYRPDLLRSLIESQKLILPETEESPKVSMWLRSLDGTPVRKDYEDRPLISAPQAVLVAEVTGISTRRIRSLAVSLDESPPQILKPSSEREWILDLSQTPWKRGEHLLKIRLQTPETEVTEIERILYRPAPPTIEWTPAWKGEIREAEVIVKASVIPTEEPLKVELRVRRSGQDDEVVLRTWETHKKLEIAETVAIEPGENRLELVAFNTTAPEIEREFETAHAPMFVRRATPPKVPRIVLNDVSVVPDQGVAEQLELAGDQYHTPWPKIRLRGQISSEAELASAGLRIGKINKDFAGFKPNNVREFAFDETMELSPGSQSIQLRAAVGDVQETKQITVAYEPPAPQIASLGTSGVKLRDLPPRAKNDPRIFYEGYHDPAITVAATLDGRLESPYRATVMVNDTPVANEFVQIDRSQSDHHQLTAKVVLTGGKNRITLRTDNEWNRQPNSQAIDVELRRPPEILEVIQTDKLVSGPPQLTLRVRSQLPVRSAKVLVDGTGERQEFTVAPSNNSPDEWLLKTNQLGLAEGVHTLQITATNDEGITLVPIVHEMHTGKAAVPPPVLTILSPVSTEMSSDASLTVNSRNLRLQYQVNSEAPTKLRLQIQGNSSKFEIFEKMTDVNDVPIDGSPGFEDLELFDGVNEIELTAESPGGSSKKQLITISCVPRTTTVEILSVGDERPRLKNDGTGYFDNAVLKSRMKLRGRVHLPDVASGRQLAARIWVNNFKLPTTDVVVDEKDPTTGLFEADVVFNSARGNEIRVEVFRAEGRLASEVGSTNTLIIDCAAPEREQELYVLLLGSGDGDEMRDRFRTAMLETALGARQRTKQQASQEVWESKVFAHIHVHDALNAPPASVQNRLREMVGKMIRNLKSGLKSGQQSIVMIYFQGQVTLTKDDFAFGAIDPANPLSRAITGRMLEENLSRSYGAHLIFLDLQQGAMNLQNRDVWPRAPHLGIAVHNWKGKAAQPENATMSSVLQQVFPQTKVVRELAEKMDRRYSLTEKQFPGQIETVDLLENVYPLRIGAFE